MRIDVTHTGSKVREFIDVDAPITCRDAWSRAVSDFTIRSDESLRRQAMLSAHSEKSRLQRKRHIEGCLIGAFILFALLAWWGNKPTLTQAGAGDATHVAPAPAAPLTAENAPVALKKVVKGKRKAAK